MVYMRVPSLSCRVEVVDEHELLLKLLGRIVLYVGWSCLCVVVLGSGHFV